MTCPNCKGSGTVLTGWVANPTRSLCKRCHGEGSLPPTDAAVLISRIEVLESQVKRLQEERKAFVGVDMAEGKDQTVTAWYRLNGDTAELCHISPSGVEEREEKDES